MGHKLTERDREVLAAIGKMVKRNSPVEDRQWCLPTKRHDVPEVVATLARNGWLRKRPKGGYREVQPTEKGWKQIANDEESQRYLRENLLLA